MKSAKLMRRPLKPLLRIALLLVIFIVILSIGSGLYEDWLWFHDLGYPILFWTPLLSKLVIQLINGSMLFVLIAGTLISGRHAFTTFYNNKVKRRIRLVEDYYRPTPPIDQRKVTIYLLIISALISVVVSFIVGFTGWLDVLCFINSSPFDLNDPLFNRDLSFFVFKLPFFQTLYNAFFPPLLILTVFTVLFYLITRIIKINSILFWKKGAVVMDPTARKHIGILLAILFALKAFGYYLERFRLVYTQNGYVTGAGYTDIHVSLPVLKILIFLTLICFVLSLFSLKFQDSRFIIIPAPFLIFISILGHGILPSAVQSLIVIPNELDKETPYIASEIELTRFAYGLDKIEEKDYPGNAPIDSFDLKAEINTLENIRLNDPRPMIQIYTQKQGIRLYYKFQDIDIDRYKINGEYRQVMISPREISIQDLEPKAQTFVNTKFRYTHGFGIALSFANELTAKGLPAFAVSNIPPQSDYPELSITEPRIYFGELTNDWVVVNTRFKEFDYPRGTGNAENNYNGTTGITLTPFNKLMISLHRTTPRFYLAREVTSQSKILLYRNILERVQKLAPFFEYDDDPYPVIDNGGIKWIIDGYTTANTIPYSSKYPDKDLNYIRNSIKAVVDAYNGTVDFYALDYDDPILKTYSKIFPGVFKDISEMPYSLKSHLRYPETMFKIQSDMLNSFHMTNPKDFYNKEDTWSVAKELYGSDPQHVEPYFVIMTLPGETQPEFVLMLPFTPASSESNLRNNLIAWLAARMDGDNYGKLILYKLPKNIEIDGPFQIESRIDQDPEISRQLALWNQQGSSVIRGNLLVIPIGGNFLFVEPIYLQSTTSGGIPEIRRVIVAYEDNLVMAKSVEEGLRKIFGKNTPALQKSTLLIQEAEDQIEDLSLEAQNIDDLLKQIKKMRELLDSLENQLTALIDEKAGENEFQETEE